MSGIRRQQSKAQHTHCYNIVRNLNFLKKSTDFFEKKIGSNVILFTRAYVTTTTTLWLGNRNLFRVSAAYNRQISTKPHEK